MTENIKANIAKLLALYEGERQRASELSARLTVASAELAQQKLEIEELKRQMENLKLSGAFVAGSSNAEAKDRITKLIAQIDRCLSLLEE